MVALSEHEAACKIVSGDWHEDQGDIKEATTCRLEAAIGARVNRGPGDRGYNPMMAKMMAGLGRSHAEATDARDGRCF